MGELAPLAGSASVFVVLAVVIGYLLKSNRDDRQQAEEQITAANKRAKEARTEVAELEKELDAEQVRRRQAEDREAKLARKVDTLSEKVEALSTEVENLRVSMT